MIHDFDKSCESISYIYKFSFKDGREKEFMVNLERKTLEQIERPDETYPDWARLDNHTCPNCPLTGEEWCPTAVCVSDLIEFVGDTYSYEDVYVEVKTNNRTYSKDTSVQKGVSSLLGIYMSTSGCPVLAKLKPMVRYHLPFASLGENSYRVLSMYLVAQYFARKRGEESDWDLEKLSGMYDEIHVVNKSFWQRLSHLNFKDAGVNALIMLDNSASHIVFQIDEGQLSEIEFLCDKYFD